MHCLLVAARVDSCWSRYQLREILHSACHDAHVREGRPIRDRFDMHMVPRYILLSSNGVLPNDLPRYTLQSTASRKSYERTLQGLQGRGWLPVGNYK